MLIYGNLKTNKTDILIQNYARLLNEGVNSDEILVIIQNSKLKDEFIKKTKKILKIEALTKFNVYSYFGLCYNKVLEFYPLIEEKITTGDVKILPETCGLEASRYIFKNAVDKIQFKGYNSKVNLLHQLLRRQSLITLNALTDAEVNDRTKVLKESFTYDIKNAINLYKKETLVLRAFDYLRQVQLFSYVYKNAPNSYKYVFLDDADEITPSLFEYLKFIKKDVKEFFVAFDPLGSSRRGYLCAMNINFELFLNEKPNYLEKDETADLVYEKISKNETIELKNLKSEDFIRADFMTDSLINNVNSLLNKSVKPEDILIVIPENDPFLKLYLNKITAPVNFITGSEKIEDNKTVSALISTMELIIENENHRISSYKLKRLLGQILKIDINAIIKIIQNYEADFGEKNIFEILNEFKNFGEVEKFLSIYKELKNEKLSNILFKLSDIFIEKTEDNKDDIQKINELLKQLRDFENIFKNFERKELLLQLQNTIISENPLSNNGLKENSINVSTLQKAIDFKIFHKYLFIYNASDINWIKQDIGPLYNAWVFQKNWIKKDFTLSDNINLSNDKTARMLRKLYLLNKGEIKLLSSAYNFLGLENFKGIKNYFLKKDEELKPEFKIIPRLDQKPVLDYEKGKFAVMAVAGAGKTTVMLALIIKLIQKGIKPENIFVLTYMDSAARTFKERIKNCFPDLRELPNISTIHGLSMRILRENNNHAHIGLDVDFDIIDEIKRLKLINEIVYNEGGSIEKANSYERAISSFKNAKYKNFETLPPSFKRIYNFYQKSLKELNLIDYDDLLILALELLKNNSKIREYYQNLAHYVIEDEAQDSSEIQQELINIIAKKNENIIRCGDVNQAITSTFTNSDVSGFRKFIQNNENCKMNRTARNSTGIIKIANKLIKKGLEISPSSFFKIETKPAAENPVEENACCAEIFEKENDEKKFIINKIKEIFEKEEKAAVGVLTRTNKEAADFAQYIKTNINRKVITSSDTVANNPVYKTVLGIFNFISNPLNNNFIVDFFETMTDMGFYKNDIKIFDKIKSINSPFILENNEEFAIWWDLRYFLELITLSPFELAFKIGEFYFLNDKKRKINISPVSSIVSKIYNTAGNFEETLDKMNEIYKKGGGGFKLFKEEDGNKKRDGLIYVMTLHKSKGDEFDYVFIPDLTDKNLGLSEDEIKLKEGIKIIQNVQNSKKTDAELKKEIIDENLRLFYVGLTRAKKKIYLTSSKEYKIFNKVKKLNPSKIFELVKGEL